LVGGTGVTFGSGVTTGTANYAIDATTKEGSAGAIVNGGSATALTVTGLDNSGGTVTVASAATLNVSGADHTNSSTNKADDAVTIIAGATLTLDSNGDGGNQVENITVKGNGAATTVTVSDGAATTYIAAGDQNVTFAGSSAQFSGKTITDSLTAGVTELKLTTVTAAATFTKAGVDTFNIAVDAMTDDRVITVASGANVKVTVNQTQSNNTEELEFTASATTASTNSITFTADNSTATTLNVTLPEVVFSNFATVNMVAVDKIYGASSTTAAQVLLDADATLNISGSATVNIKEDADTSDPVTLISASGLTKALTIEASANWKSITGGSGDDVFKVTAGAVKYVLDGGAGNDTLSFADTTNINTTGASFTNFEVIKLDASTEGTETVTVGSALVSGKDLSVITGDGTHDDTLAVIAKSTSIDLSKLVIGDDVLVTLDTTAYTSSDLTIVGTSTLAMELNGQDGNDTITGGAGGDTIDGGDGNNVLDGGKGNDLISGGEAADVIIGGAGNDYIWGNKGADVITLGTGYDTIELDFDTTSDSTSTAFDTIKDYVSGDQIYLYDMDIGNSFYDDSEGDTVDLSDVEGTTTRAALDVSTGVAKLTSVTDTSTLAKAVKAVEAAIDYALSESVYDAADDDTVNGLFAVFNFGSDAYLFISDGTSGVTAADILVKLEGKQVTDTGVTLATLSHLDADYEGWYHGSIGITAIA